MIEITEEISKRLEEISVAHFKFKNIRADFKNKYPGGVEAVNANLKTAMDDYMAWGRYDDCGPGYELEYRECSERAIAVLGDLRDLISAQKYVKLLKHQFVEDFPRHASMLA